MNGGNFVVAIRANEEKSIEPAVGQNNAKETQRSGVSPLKVVEEEHDTISRAEDTQELAEGAMESIGSLGWPKFCDGRLRANDQLEVWQNVKDYPAIRRQRLA